MVGADDNRANVADKYSISLAQYFFGTLLCPPIVRRTSGKTKHTVWKLPILSALLGLPIRLLPRLVVCHSIPESSE
jgi:hypothetical protein